MPQVTKVVKRSLSPIFIVGTPRSGTTLTAKILGRHSRLFMPGETHFFADIYSRINELGDITDQEVRLEVAKRLFTLYGRYNEPEDQQRITSMFPAVSDLANALRGCQNYGEIFGRFMELQMEATGMFRWGNNAPRDLFSAIHIREFFPDARLVVCVRDARAFICSYKGKWKNTSEEHVERLKKLYHPVVTSYLWKSSIRQLPLLKQIFPAENRIVVRYEDLVSKSEDTVKQICAIIGEDFEPAMLDVDTHNSSNVIEAEGIFSASIDRWKTELLPEEIRISQAIGAQELKQLDYELMHIPASRLRLVSIWLATPLALWNALSANRATRGPLIPYLFRRLAALLAPGGN